jgi:hypothetical protein
MTMWEFIPHPPPMPFPSQRPPCQKDSRPENGLCPSMLLKMDCSSNLKPKLPIRGITTRSNKFIACD